MSEPAAALVRPALRLTHAAALRLVAAAVEAATGMGVPQVIAVVDEGCNLLAFVRMDFSRVLSIDIVQRKAMTAAATGKPTGSLDPANEMKLGVASDGRMTNLKGGLPILVDGHLIGGIGVGSGTGDQDAQVARAALLAVGFEVAGSAGSGFPEPPNASPPTQERRPSEPGSS